jgi:transposase
MWTDADRRTYRQVGNRLPSDLTDLEWERLASLISAAKPGGRPRKTDMRSAMNAIF